MSHALARATCGYAGARLLCVYAVLASILVLLAGCVSVDKLADTMNKRNILRTIRGCLWAGRHGAGQYCPVPRGAKWGAPATSSPTVSPVYASL